MKRLFVILFLFLTIFPIYNINAEATNAGFVPSNIWYSKDPFFDGDKIKIYTLVFNPDSREFSGTVNFYNDTVFLGKKSFVVEAKSIKDLSIDWTVGAGSHKIFAKIENAKFLISEGKYEEAIITKNQTDESLRTVNKKIIPKTINPDTSTDTGIDSIQNIKNIILEKTPDSVQKGIVLGVSTVDELRQNMSTASDNKKSAVEKEIKILNKKTPSKDTNEPSKLLKPFKYAELFFLTILSFILNTKIVFYLLSAAIVYFSLRYLWNLIF